MRRLPRGQLLRFSLLVVGGGVVPPYALAAYALWRGARRRAPSGHFDAGVVLGCAVLPDGRPSRALRARAEGGATLFLRGLVPRLVLSGGFSPGRPSEAAVMAEVARAAGVPEAALLREEASHSTVENLQHSARLLGHPGRLLVITERYHLGRALRAARGLGLTAEGFGVDSPRRGLYDWSKIILRECTSILWHAAR